MRKVKSSLTLLASIADSAVIDEAYLWLCKQRKSYPANADVWHFRRHWQSKRRSLIKVLHTGRYNFSPLQRLVLANDKTIHLWCAQDALVQKAMAIVLEPLWPISP